MKRKVLIFEDDMISSMVLEKILTHHGYESMGRYDSADELTQLTEQHQPDLILLDIMLNGNTSGLEAAAKLRTNRETPILFLTALSDQETRATVDSISNSKLLNKPYVQGEILRTISSMLEQN